MDKDQKNEAIQKEQLPNFGDFFEDIFWTFYVSGAAYRKDHLVKSWLWVFIYNPVGHREGLVTINTADNKFTIHIVISIWVFLLEIYLPRFLDIFPNSDLIQLFQPCKSWWDWSPKGLQTKLHKLVFGLVYFIGLDWNRRSSYGL